MKEITNKELPEEIRRAYLRWGDIKNIDRVLKIGYGKRARYRVFIRSGGGEIWRYSEVEKTWHFQTFHTYAASG